MAERKYFTNFGKKTWREYYHEGTESYSVKYLTGKGHDFVYIWRTML